MFRTLGLVIITVFSRQLYPYLSGFPLRSVRTDPTKLETQSVYINFDLLYRNGTKTDSQFPPIQALPPALAKVSIASPTRSIHSGQCRSRSLLNRSYNDRHLLVEPEVRVILSRQSRINKFCLLFSSMYCTTGWKTAALPRRLRNTGQRR